MKILEIKRVIVHGCSTDGPCWIIVAVVNLHQNASKNCSISVGTRIQALDVVVVGFQKQQINCYRILHLHNTSQHITIMLLIHQNSILSCSPMTEIKMMVRNAVSNSHTHCNLNLLIKKTKHHIKHK